MENKIKELEEKLLRKEQECERLNEHSVGFARKCQKLELDVCHLKDKNYNLQRQLDQLKAENDTYKKMFEDEDVQLALTEIRSGERHLWYNKTEKYKQTLAEIRDIATCCIEGDVARIRMKQILQICDEVNDER